MRSVHTRRLLALSVLAAGVTLVAFTSQPLAAQDKKKGTKPDPDAPPQVKLVLPLGATPGSTVKLTLRGSRLDEVIHLAMPSVPATYRILEQAKAPPPDKLPPGAVGNTQVVVELALPKDVPGDALEFTVFSRNGESTPHRLLIDRDPVVAEKEPNDGFRQAQPIQLPQVVYGTVSRNQDVDVFRFEGRAGQRVAAEVFAARHGSPLDSILTLYDDAGQELAGNDDFGGSLDSRLTCTLPRNGTYYLSLIDAHDAGGQLYVYRLALKAEK